MFIQLFCSTVCIAVVQSLRHIRLFAAPWTATRQASCPSPFPDVCSNLCPLSQWCQPNHLILNHPLLLSSIFPSIRVYSNESAFCIRWPMYWSFSFNISPSNEHSGLISFRVDWFDLLAVQRNPQESSPAPQYKSIKFFAFSLLYGPTLTSVHNYWGNHSFYYTDLCQHTSTLE